MYQVTIVINESSDTIEHLVSVLFDEGFEKDEHGVGLGSWSKRFETYESVAREMWGRIMWFAMSCEASLNIGTRIV